MAKIIQVNLDAPQNPEDVYMTSAQIQREYSVTDKEIFAMEQLGYLTRIVLDRKAKRYWRADVEAGVHAHRDGLPPPPATYMSRTSTNWEV